LLTSTDVEKENANTVKNPTNNKQKQPNKKLRLSEEDSLDIIEAPPPGEMVEASKPSRKAKTKAKKNLNKKTKKKASVASTTTTTANTTLASMPTSPQSKKESNKQVNWEFQTPKQTQAKLDAILNTNTKTIKPKADHHKPPATPATTGKVKQMVNLVEQKIRETNNCAQASVFHTAQPTPGKLLKTVEKTQPRVLRHHTRQQQQQQQALRTSIDKRKLRVSQAKLDSKRQSIKQVKALVSSVQHEASSRPKPALNESCITLDMTVTTSNGSDKVDRHLARDIMSSTHIRDNYKVLSFLDKSTSAYCRNC
jgi:hypothetical protein